MCNYLKYNADVSLEVVPGDITLLSMRAMQDLLLRLSEEKYKKDVGRNRHGKAVKDLNYVRNGYLTLSDEQKDTLRQKRKDRGRQRGDKSGRSANWLKESAELTLTS
jgi:hypothetical protein